MKVTRGQNTLLVFKKFKYFKVKTSCCKNVSKQCSKILGKLITLI